MFALLLAGPAVVLGNEPLHPLGDFDSLPVWPKNKHSEMVSLTVNPPPDAALRKKTFTQRNSPKNIKALCLSLNAALEPDASGLGKFRELVKGGNYAEALDAYRIYFFAKLKTPENYGAHRQNLLGYQLKAGKKWVLQRVDPQVIEWAMQGIYTFDGQMGQVGPPGQISWVPHGLELPDGTTYGRSGNDHSFWKTDAGRATGKKIEFFRAVNKFPLDHMPPSTRLLQSYTLTGEQNHLNRACEILDDWALNSRRDIDAFPIDVRSATELESEWLRAFPGMFRVMLDERPSLAEQFHSPTLARLMLHLLSDYIPYTIRAKRTELANWGVMGIGNALHFATLFQEFRSMTYARRELWRLWNVNFTHFFALDGASWEAADTGHSRIAVPRARECMPYARLPDFVGELESAAFDDLLRDRMRYVMVQMTPWANQHPRFDPAYNSHPKTEWLEPKWTTFDKVSAMKELLWDRDLEVRLRMNAAKRNLGLIDAAKAPGVRSDLAPYAAMAYLRESWNKDAHYFQLSDYQGSSANLAMRYVAAKSVVFGRANGRFDLSMSGCNLLVGDGLAVDRKPGNFYYGWAKTGGKTRYCAQPGHTVAGNRFHSSERFDFAESVQSKPYQRPPEGVRTDSHLFNLYNVIPGLDNEPVTDVRTTRQVFALHDEGLYFVNTRMDTGNDKEREYTQFLGLPTWVPAKKMKEAKEKVRALSEAGHRLIVKDEKAGFLATSNPARENVSIHLEANSPLVYANGFNGKGEHIPSKPQLELMDENLKKWESRKMSEKEFPKRWLSQLLRPISVRWNGKGSQVFLMTLSTRKASADEIAFPLTGGLQAYEKTRGGNGVLGCSVTTQKGTRVWFQTGPRARNALRAGPVEANGEALLAMKKNGVLSGIALGAESIRMRGNVHALATNDAEFSLDDAGNFSSQAIRRPIDTIRISPAQTAFVDSLDIRFDIPGQDSRKDLEFRYSLDGSDPTLESALYTHPLRIDRTCMVKVRPFRKGLRETPWNFPGMDAGKTMSAIFTKVDYQSARQATDLKPGVKLEYLEGDWPDLFMNAGDSEVIPVLKKEQVSSLLNAKDIAAVRKTNQAYAVRYRGILEIPKDGIYVFHAPPHLFDVTMDAGYDLRVWVDGKEWFPEPGLHARNSWSVALKKGAHDFKVAFVDFRGKTFKSEYWLPWQEGQVWQGIPILRISGPGIKKMPLHTSWLKHSELK